MKQHITGLTYAENLELTSMLRRLAIFLNEHKDKIDMANADNCMYGCIYTTNDKAFTIDFNEWILPDEKEAKENE